MQLPQKPHSPQSYKKKTDFKRKSTSQQDNESTSQRNESTGQREIELSNYRDFERAEAIVLTSLTS